MDVASDIVALVQRFWKPIGLVIFWVAAGDVDLDYDLIWTRLWDGPPSKSYPWTLMDNDFLHC